MRFRIQLRDVEPIVWRRVLVPDGYSFWDLHVAIQDAMGKFTARSVKFDDPQKRWEDAFERDS